MFRHVSFEIALDSGTKGSRASKCEANDRLATELRRSKCKSVELAVRNHFCLNTRTSRCCPFRLVPGLERFMVPSKMPSLSQRPELRPSAASRHDTLEQREIGSRG